MTRIYRYIGLWLPVFTWAGIIFLFSNRPSIHTVDFYLGDFLLKKTAHLVEYAILSILLYRAFLGSGTDRTKAVIISIAISITYAISDEYHQSFIPGRESRLRDVVIDTIGAIIGVNIWKIKKY